MTVIIGNTEEIVQHVHEFQVDIRGIEGQTNDKKLSIHPFIQDELFIISSPAYSDFKSKMTLHDLQNHTWITREKGSGTRDYIKTG